MRSPEVPRIRWIGNGQMKWWWLPPIIGALLIGGLQLVLFDLAHGVIAGVTWLVVAGVFGYLRNARFRDVRKSANRS